MTSFKLKLVSYFALVAIVPVGGAFYGFDNLAKRHETERIDNRLHADLRAAVAGYAQELDAAERRARPVPLGAAVARLGAGIDPRDELVAVRNGAIVDGPHRGGRVMLGPSIPGRVVLGGVAYRALLTPPLTVGTVSFAALAPQRELDAAISSSRRRLVLAVATVVAIFALIVYMLGASIVRTLGRLAQAADEVARGRFRERVRVQGRDEFAQLAEAFNRMAAQLEERIVELEHERRRTREVTVRFGKALTATHDVDLLLRVIVETMVGATGAAGGTVHGGAGELARAGDPAAGSRELELPLHVSGERFGTVVLTGDSFGAEQVDTATSLASQAAVALENAQLHSIVEQQALVDPLTGLANRRSIEESLQEEVSRAERFEGDVCFVLADLDRFKSINDRHGHPTGDRALRMFAQTLQDVVREVDSAGRWGGEEFALVLPGTDLAGGVALAERIRATLATRETTAPSGEAVHVTASFGVAAYPQNGELSMVVAAADEALYWAKRHGRDRVEAAVDIPSR